MAGNVMHQAAGGSYFLFDSSAMHEMRAQVPRTSIPDPASKTTSTSFTDALIGFPSEVGKFI